MGDLYNFIVLRKELSARDADRWLMRFMAVVKRVLIPAWQAWYPKDKAI